MKKLLIILLLALSGNAMAQSLVIGSQAPIIKNIKWLSGTYNPKVGHIILFYQESNTSCVYQYNKLKEIVNNKEAQGVVITRDGDIDAEVLSDGGKIAVGYDSDGDIFNAYGVKYLPFAIAVGVDGKVEWIGALRD